MQEFFSLKTHFLLFIIISPIFPPGLCPSATADVRQQRTTAAATTTTAAAAARRFHRPPAAAAAPATEFKGLQEVGRKGEEEAGKHRVKKIKILESFNRRIPQAVDSHNSREKKKEKILESSLVFHEMSLRLYSDFSDLAVRKGGKVPQRESVILPIN